MHNTDIFTPAERAELARRATEAAKADKHIERINKAAAAKTNPLRAKTPHVSEQR